MRCDLDELSSVLSQDTRGSLHLLNLGASHVHNYLYDVGRLDCRKLVFDLIVESAGEGNVPRLSTREAEFTNRFYDRRLVIYSCHGHPFLSNATAPHEPIIARKAACCISLLTPESHKMRVPSYHLTATSPHTSAPP